ncbi:MAG: FAD-dependent oxidoreductase, partial [Pseudomonadota bacterium]
QVNQPRLEIGIDDATNWEQSIALNPSVVVHVDEPEQIAAVLTDHTTYPSPIRALGSRHSTTHCGVCDGGTLLVTRRMDRIVSIDETALTVTVQSGALYIDVAKALEARGLQFYVNVEIGNLTMGSAACTGTKDASLPGEFGQVASYCCAMRMVLPDGTVRTVTEVEPALLQAARSGYGLLGVVFEVTFRVRKLEALAVHHRTYTLDEFERELPALREQGDSMMYYLFPFLDSLTVEFRRYVPGKAPSSRWLWRVRNLFWKTVVPAICHIITVMVKPRRPRAWLLDRFSQVIQLILNTVIRSDATFASDQLIRYPEKRGFDKYTFSIWAFPETDIMFTMRAYYQFCQDYDAEHGLRCDMLNVGYRILKDTNPLFSYSYDGTVMTLDPVCTAREPGWDAFLVAYNEFCSTHGGVPLFNQSKWLTPEQVAKAFGDRIGQFEDIRRSVDPHDRLLNHYFAQLFRSRDADGSEPIRKSKAA